MNTKPVYDFVWEVVRVGLFGMLMAAALISFICLIPFIPVGLLVKYRWPALFNEMAPPK